MAGRLTAEQMMPIPMMSFGPGRPGEPESFHVFGTHGESEWPSVRVGTEIVNRRLENPKRYRDIIQIGDKDIPVTYGRVHILFGNHLASASTSIDSRFSNGGVDLNRMWDPKRFLSLNTEWTEEALKATPEYKRRLAIDAELFGNPDLNLVLGVDHHTTKKDGATPFIIADTPTGLLVASTFEGVKVVSDGWGTPSKDANPGAEPGGLDDGGNRHGIDTICWEAGSRGDPETATRIIGGVESGVLAAGHTDQTLITHETRRVTAVGTYHTQDEFTFAQQFTDFDPIPVDTVLGYDGDREVRLQDVPSIARRMERDGLTHVVTMFCGGTKPPRMEAGVYGVDSTPIPAGQVVDLRTLRQARTRTQPPARGN